MAKATQTTTKKTSVSVRLNPKSSGTGSKRCPTCGKYMGGKK